MSTLSEQYELPPGYRIFPACRFYVQIATPQSGAGGAAQAVFNEVSGLQVEMQVTEYEEGGQNDFVHRLPGRLRVGNVTLKRGLTRSAEFLKWCMRPERRNLTISLFDVDGQPVTHWHFADAYPVKWSGPQFAADGTAVALETIELAHKGLTVDGT
jgi:phage tail-like protein